MPVRVINCLRLENFYRSRLRFTEPRLIIETVSKSVSLKLLEASRARVCVYLLLRSRWFNAFKRDLCDVKLCAAQKAFPICVYVVMPHYLESETSISSESLFEVRFNPVHFIAFN